MTLIELLVFMLLSAGLGLLGSLFSVRWGWLAGMIPFGFVVVVMQVAAWKFIFRSFQYGFRSRPTCQAGKCTARQYVLVKASKDSAVFRCRCGSTYISEGNKFSALLPDGSVRPYMVRNSSNIWKPVELAND